MRRGQEGAQESRNSREEGGVEGAQGGAAHQRGGSGEFETLPQ